MDYGGGLENRFRESERGFESHPLRQTLFLVQPFVNQSLKSCITRREMDENPRIPGKGIAGRVWHSCA